MAELRVRGLSVRLGGVDVVNDFSLDLSSGEAVSVTGGSGSGKTVALKSVLGLLGPSRGALVRGEVIINGFRVIPEKPLRNVVIGYQPQDFEYSFITPRVGEELTSSALTRLSSFKEALNSSASLLRRVGLSTDYLLRPINTLSGGEMQCVSILRSLIRRPELLVLDEPFTQMDPVRRGAVEELIKELLGEGSAALIAEHEGFNHSFTVSKRVRIGCGGLRVSGDLTLKPPHINESVTLTIRNLWFSYGGREVLRGAELRVEAGEAVALVGPNGSGKTTLVKLVMGFLKPAEGVVELAGENPSRVSCESLPRLAGYTSQFPSTSFLSDTVINELRLASQLSGESLNYALRLAKSLGLEGRLDSPIHSLTKCEQLALSITESLMFRPALLIIDEVHQCCDHQYLKSLLKSLVKSLSGLGYSLLVTSHSEGVINGCGFRVARIRDGVIEE